MDRESIKKDIKKSLNELCNIKECFINIKSYFYEYVRNIDNIIISNGTDYDITSNLRSIVELLISNIHSSINKVNCKIRPKFNLWIQEYDDNQKKYDIGFGDNKEENFSLGNINLLVPFKFNLKSRKESNLTFSSIGDVLISIPSFSLLFDSINLSLKIRLANIEDSTELIGKKKYHDFINNNSICWFVIEWTPFLDNLDKKNINEYDWNYIIFNLTNNDGMHKILNYLNSYIKQIDLNINILNSRELLFK